jgi:hypothetical protein
MSTSINQVLNGQIQLPTQNNNQPGTQTTPTNTSSQVNEK